MEYEVLKTGYVLLPMVSFWNAEGVCAFASLDRDPTWEHRPRPVGHYVSSVRIPGNLLADGLMSVTAILHTLNPFIVQFIVPNAVSFQVVDSLEGDSARGDYTGRVRGVLRPLLEWNTLYSANGREPKELPTRQFSSINQGARERKLKLFE